MIVKVEKRILHRDIQKGPHYFSAMALPQHTKVLHFWEESDNFCVYILCSYVDGGVQIDNKSFYLAVTGQELPEEFPEWKGYVGTATRRIDHPGLGGYTETTYHLWEC